MTELNLEQILTEESMNQQEDQLLKRLTPLFLLKPNLKHLLNKQYQYIKSKKYDEYTAGYEIIKLLLCSEQFTQNEIIRILNKNNYLNHSSWLLTPEGKAKANEMLKENLDFSFQWLKVNIKKIIVFTGQKSFIKIILEPNDQLDLNEDEMLNANKFRQKYFVCKGVMLTPIDATVWSYLLTTWQQEKGERTEKELASEDTEARELIIDYIENAGVVNEANKEKALNYGFVYSTDGKVFLSGRIIKNLMRKNDLKITQEKLRYLLNDYIISNSTPIKIGGTTKRFWIFNKSMFELKEEISEDIKEGETID